MYTKYLGDFERLFLSFMLHKNIFKLSCVFAPCAGGAPVGAWVLDGPSEEAPRLGSPAGGDHEATDSTQIHSASAPPPAEESDCGTEENQAVTRAGLGVFIISGQTSGSYRPDLLLRPSLSGLMDLNKALKNQLGVKPFRIFKQLLSHHAR